MAKTTHAAASKPGPGPGASNDAANGPAVPPVTTPPGGPSLDTNDDDLPPETPPKSGSDLEEAAREQARGRQGDDSRPYCPRHNCHLKSDGATKVATKYRCPVPGCETREKRARPQVKIPAEPMTCPNRSCATGGEKQFLEANPDKTTGANLHMECPACGFHVKVPRPQFTPQLARQRAAAAADSFDDR